MEVSFPERFNLADYFLDARIRESMGARPAVAVGEEEWSYQDVFEMSNRAGDVLRSRGIDMEDRVLMLLPDGIEFVATWFGILKSGACFCMANPRITEDDMRYLLSYTRAKAVVAHADTLEQLEPALRDHPRCKVRLLVGTDRALEGWELWNQAIENGNPALPSQTGNEIT